MTWVTKSLTERNHSMRKLRDSNAHGRNEYLHLPTARRLTRAVAHLLDARRGDAQLLARLPDGALDRRLARIELAARQYPHFTAVTLPTTDDGGAARLQTLGE